MCVVVEGRNMAKAPFNVVKREDLHPICPHCEKEFAEIYTQGKGTAFVEGRTLVYFCPNCHKVLGFSQGRMI